MPGLTRLFGGGPSAATPGDGGRVGARIRRAHRRPRIVCESLPALGVIDTGEDDTADGPGPSEGAAPEISA